MPSRRNVKNWQEGSVYLPAFYGPNCGISWHRLLRRTLHLSVHYSAFVEDPDVCRGGAHYSYLDC